MVQSRSCLGGGVDCYGLRRVDAVTPFLVSRFSLGTVPNEKRETRNEKRLYNPRQCTGSKDCSCFALFFRPSPLTGVRSPRPIFTRSSGSQTRASHRTDRASSIHTSSSTRSMKVTRLRFGSSHPVVRSEERHVGKECRA